MKKNIIVIMMLVNIWASGFAQQSVSWEVNNVAT